MILSEGIFNQIDGTEESSKRTIEKILAEDKILIEYVYFLSKKKSKQDSIKLLKKFYDIEQNHATIENILDGWIKILKIRISDKTNKNKTLESLEKSVQNKVLTGKFLKEEFGDYYKRISPNVLKDLITAIIHTKSDPEESINDLGRALEDFLRIDLNSGLNLSKCQGIAQIAQLFNQNNKFPTKLNNLTAGLSSIRSMGKAHGVDKKENQRWKIMETTSLSTTLIVISLMKSYMIYTQKSKLIF